MKCAVLGSGGREHALAWRLRLDGADVCLIPGNSALEGSIPCDPLDSDALQKTLNDQDIDLVVIGPEALLAAGIADELRERRFRVVGPGRKACALESSKRFAKEFMQKHGVATARYVSAVGATAARGAASTFGGPLVVKYDGLAAGKGVVVCDSAEEALAAIESLCATFGADAPFVLEERLKGREVSILVLTDGTTVLHLPPAQDHKRLCDDDLGPNTGGMGVVSPPAWLTATHVQEIEQTIVAPTLRGLAADQLPYRGFLYFGVMVTATGPMLLEYNVRLGDPEAQAILPRIEGDFFAALMRCADGDLSGASWHTDSQATVCVVTATRNYPLSSESGVPITGLPAYLAPNTWVFHSGTQRRGEQWQTAGGRVLSVVSKRDSLPSSRAASYEALRSIKFDGMLFRSDIGKS